MNLFFALLIAACGSTTPANSAPEAAKTNSGTKTEAPVTVATWSGGTVSSADLDDSIRTNLIKLEAEFVTGQHEARQQGLDALIGEKVLEAEAAKRADIVAAELTRHHGWVWRRRLHFGPPFSRNRCSAGRWWT